MAAAEESVSKWLLQHQRVWKMTAAPKSVEDSYIMKVVGRGLQKKGEWLHHEVCRKKATEKWRMAAS
jgi:hypothetical protein